MPSIHHNNVQNRHARRPQVKLQSIFFNCQAYKKGERGLIQNKIQTEARAREMKMVAAHVLHLRATTLHANTTCHKFYCRSTSRLNNPLTYILNFKHNLTLLVLSPNEISTQNVTNRKQGSLAVTIYRRDSARLMLHSPAKSRLI